MLLLLSLVVSWMGPMKASGGDLKPTFANPVYEGADPWVVQQGEDYYLCQAEGDGGICVYKSTKVTDRGVKRVVWQAPPNAWNSHQIWAPELHWIQGRWYIYYAADTGDNATHRMGVLEAVTDDPQGPYRDRGQLYTGDDIEGKSHNRWAIDGTPLAMGDRLYFVWSGWPSTQDIQYLYIAPMENPWTISGKRVRLCENATYFWERVGERRDERGLNEGPQILRRNGRVFIVYSCSSSWEATYKLNLLWMDERANPLDPRSWSKGSRPAFQGTERVHGVGHCSFVRSPDGREDWLVYHSKLLPEPGWRRVVNLQKFTWTAEGFPDFGVPVAPGEVLPAPSGEAGNRPGGIFQDSLDGGQWDAWAHDSPGWSIRLEDGALRLGRGRPLGRTHAARSGEKAWVRGFDWADAVLQARIRLDRGDGAAGLLLRVRHPAVGCDAQKGYFAGLELRSRRVVLGKTNGFRWKEIAGAKHPVDLDTWYRLRVEAVGNRLRVFLDDTLKIDAKDPDYAVGMAGIRVVNARACFDDFQVVPQ